MKEISERDLEDFDFSKLERPPNPHCKDKRFTHKLTNSTDMKLYLDSAGGLISQEISKMKTIFVGKVLAKDDHFS